MFVIKTQNTYVSTIVAFDFDNIDVLTDASIKYAARFRTYDDANFVINNSWLADETCHLVVVADYANEDEGYVFDMSELEFD